MSSHVVSRTCTGGIALERAAITPFPHLLRCDGDKCKSCKPRATFINFSLIRTGCTDTTRLLYDIGEGGSGTP